MIYIIHNIKIQKCIRLYRTRVVFLAAFRNNYIQYMCIIVCHVFDAAGINNSSRYSLFIMQLKRIMQLRLARYRRICQDRTYID